ncbi:hypothetical protein RJ639_038304 [Escallonia herrerae]|uniref:Uncharacterized protein n=1 Tax=Escallonia herrerae TaxID=1293975 RepID=A0AA88WMW3_9ASTE|nr:hypothetical protein RJ639_038304 [Escallonia herrerae]
MVTRDPPALYLVMQQINTQTIQIVMTENLIEEIEVHIHCQDHLLLPENPGARILVQLLNQPQCSISPGLNIAINFQIFELFDQQKLALPAIPTICRETTPEGGRRMLNNTYQFSVRVGGALAPAMNYIASYHPLWGWRLSFGIVSVPISLLVLVSIFIGETPTCLIQHDKVEEAKRILRRIRGTSDIEVEFRGLLAETRRCQSVNAIAELLSTPNLPPLVVTTVAEMLLPWSGLSILSFYGPFLLQSAGYKSHEAFLAPLVIAIVTLVFTALAKYSVDFLGRRVLLLYASAVTFTSLILTLEKRLERAKRRAVEEVTKARDQGICNFLDGNVGDEWLKKRTEDGLEICELGFAKAKEMFAERFPDIPLDDFVLPAVVSPSGETAMPSEAGDAAASHLPGEGPSGDALEP